MALRGRRGRTHPGSGDLAPGHASVVTIIIIIVVVIIVAAAAGSIGGRGFHPWALEPGVLVSCHLAADELVEHDGTDNGEVGDLEEEDAGGADVVVGGEEQSQWPEKDESKQVEWWVKVGEAVRGGGLEDIDAVDVEIFFASVAYDAGEGVGEHTYKLSE